MRAFPNALLEGATNLPIALSNVQQVPVDVSWTYGLGDSNETSTAEADLVAASEWFPNVIHDWLALSSADLWQAKIFVSRQR